MERMKLPISLHQELALGQRKLLAAFESSVPRTLKAGETLETTPGPNGGIFHLRTGWACQFPALTNSRQTIVDVYLPGDMIGLDTSLGTRPLKDVLVLTSVTAEFIPARDGLMDLMTNRSTALFIAWLLGERQRRADRLFAAISGLDARGRIASMMLDFHERLRRRRLITGPTYGLPLTQTQIGQYLGLTVVHVNRVLRSLRAERILELEKHSVTIIDHNRLSRMVESRGRDNLNTGVNDGRSDAVLPAVTPTDQARIMFSSGP
jgi:CRP-like cAMP-binding protein